jgi:hypothetical protein
VSSSNQGFTDLRFDLTEVALNPTLRLTAPVIRLHFATNRPVRCRTPLSEAELEELRNSLSPPIVPNNISSKGVFPKKYYAFLTTSTGFTNAEFVEFLKANGQNFVEAGFDGGEEDIDEIEDESFGNSQPKQYYPIHAAKEPVQWEELKQRILQFGASRLRNPYKNRFEHGGSHSSIWKEIYRRKSKFLKTIMWFQHPTS